ncbi:MAG TPA: UvrD-helicase domain-containing protein [Bryobacteraceae bacterium]|nr:UvrD-helicase domain-containing protein [Bryobacteraceae bacterium]
MDFLAGLNPQQVEAVRHVEGPLLILAGAGSGKTRVITHRIAHMVCDRGIAPWSIMAVTFTNKAAEEMRQRVRTLLEGRHTGDGPMVSTFHSFCVRLLRRYGKTLGDIRPGFTSSFNIYDDDDQVSVLKSLYKQFGFDIKALPPRTALSVISKAKCDKVSPDDFAATVKDPAAKTIATLYTHYEGRLRSANALDFDDLLLEAVRLLRHDKDVRQRWNDHLKYLMIDEYQDTNRSQYELMRLLAGTNNNVGVVGDEDQSIYSWRGADIRNILDFERDFKNVTVIRLEQNYRSTKSILEAAGSVVANNIERKGKKLWTAGDAGEKIVLYQALDGENEALHIADTIEKVLHRNPGYRVAVLYRTNFQSRQIEEALRRYGRKYNVVGGFSFYQRAEIKDVIAYLRVLTSPTDNVSLLRVINTPARGIGGSTLEAIEQFANANAISAWEAIERLLETHELGARAETALRAFRALILELRTECAEKPVHEILERVVDKSGYRKMLEQDKNPDAENRVANITELLNAAAEAVERGESISDFLDHAALVSDADQLDHEAQVSLLTIHNAKGLEFPVVFIAGLEEGLFPHSRSLNSGAMLEEERRLFYVGMTRAEKLLYISHARVRRRFGGNPPEPAIPSQFLKEIPPQLIRKVGAGAQGREVDLHAEQFEVRHSVRQTLYTGKTYNSVENIATFFKERGVAADPRAFVKPETKAAVPPPLPQPASKPVVKPSKLAAGGIINHPTLGRGTIMRKEGDGPDAKLTVSFPRHGLKKLIAKYAGLTDE